MFICSHSSGMTSNINSITVLNFPFFSRYFEKNYVGRQGIVISRTQARRMKPARFPIKTWNVNSNAQLDLPTTNNFVEGWNRVMQDTLHHISHPDIFKLVLALQKEQSTQENNLVRINSGEKLAAPKPKETRKRENITRLVSSYMQGQQGQHGQQPRLEFLKGIAQNMVLGD